MPHGPPASRLGRHLPPPIDSSRNSAAAGDKGGGVAGEELPPAAAAAAAREGIADVARVFLRGRGKGGGSCSGDETSGLRSLPHGQREPSFIRAPQRFLAFIGEEQRRQRQKQCSASRPHCPPPGLTWGHIFTSLPPEWPQNLEVAERPSRLTVGGGLSGVDRFMDGLQNPSGARPSNTRPTVRIPHTPRQHTTRRRCSVEGGAECGGCNLARLENFEKWKSGKLENWKIAITVKGYSCDMCSKKQWPVTTSKLENWKSGLS